MDDRKNTDEQSATPQAELIKKPYEKPQIVYSAPLEAMAAVCIPGKADIVACPSGPISS